MAVFGLSSWPTGCAIVKVSAGWSRRSSGSSSSASSNETERLAPSSELPWSITACASSTGLGEFDDGLLVGRTIVGEIELCDGAAEAEKVVDLLLGGRLVDASHDDDGCRSLGGHDGYGKTREIDATRRWNERRTRPACTVPELKCVRGSRACRAGEVGAPNGDANAR